MTSVTREQIDRATMFKALGDPTRLRIFEFLRACCGPVAVDDETGEVRPVIGPTVGEVCCHLTGRDRVTSTISEHLKDLRIAGLIVTERRGKNVVCAVNPTATEALSRFFAEASPAGGCGDSDRGGSGGETGRVETACRYQHLDHGTVSRLEP